MTRLAIAPVLAAAGLTALAGWTSGCVAAEPAAEPAGTPAGEVAVHLRRETRVLELGPLPLDRIYPSMEGPSKRIRFDYRDMDWVTAYTTEVVDSTSGEKLGEEFFCHSQLQLDNSLRLLVTATGISEIRFPEGFGMPLTQIVRGIPFDWRGVSLLGMVLNNHEPDIQRQVNVKISIEYENFPDDTPPPGHKRLYEVSLPMTREVGPGNAGHAGHVHDDLASEGQVNPDDTCMDGQLIEGMTQHWMVEPGRQVSRKTYTDLVPVDGQVHVGLVHLHNHGVYMKLKDLTTSEEIWRTDAVYEEDRVQIAKIPAYNSAEGFRLHKDHEYEVEAVYDNTSAKTVDAMAMMYLFYHPDGNAAINFPEPPPRRTPGQ